MHRIGIVLVLLGVLAGCGGGGGSSPPPSSVGGGAVAKPTVVTVNAGQTAGGVDITVVSPASSPPPNAQVLGVASLTGTGNAFNTGATIARGATQRVLLFGPGLSGSVQITISGPSDITVSNPISIKATDGTPGISFTAAVAANVALGSRTVILQTTNGDITTFTGGLEVVP